MAFWEVLTEVLILLAAALVGVVSLQTSGLARVMLKNVKSAMLTASTAS